MIIPTKKLENGEIPVFGFGTWMIGGRYESDSTNDKEDIKAIQNAIYAGVTHIDAAEMYAAGHAEELVGQAIKEFDRKKLFITSKVWSSNLHHEDVIQSCRNSLKRLQTSYIDLYLIHKPNDEIPIEETMKALNQLKRDGLIKHIGVSNFTTKRLKEAQDCTKNKVVVNQVLYNLIYRQPEEDGLLDYCQQNDVLLVAFRPVEKGVLTHKKNDVIKQMCEKYQKTPSQIAINWLISQPNIVTICKMKHEEHLHENLGAIGWEMKNKDIEKLRGEYPNQKNNSSTPLR